MKRLLLVALCTVLIGCEAGQAERVGERIHEVEAVACPLTTVRNLERAVLNMLRMVPFFSDWEPVCEELT